MKSILILLICLLSLSFFCSCGETEDTEVYTPVAAHEVYIPADTTDEWVTLSDNNVAELMKLEIPLDFESIEDPNLRKKYHHALLLKEYGDIPQIRTIIEYELNELNRGPTVTFTNNDEHITYLNKTIAYLEAQLFLWPSEEGTQKALEDTKRTKHELEDGGIKGN